MSGSSSHLLDAMLAAGGVEVDYHGTTLIRHFGDPHGEYLAATQPPDGVIHLISSRQHYSFNLAWLEADAPSEPRVDR